MYTSSPLVPVPSLVIVRLLLQSALPMPILLRFVRAIPVAIWEIHYLLIFIYFIYVLDLGNAFMYNMFSNS